MTTHRFLIVCLACCASLLSATVCDAGPRVAVVMQDDAPPLEKHAAKELAAQWKQLFDADVQISATPAADAVATILLGSPTTNPAVKSALGDKWPKLTDQGHIVRTVTKEKNTVVVGGGSPVATLWAVYELGHRFGIRSLLHGDYYPLETPKLSVDGLDIVKEPTIRTRAFRVVDMSPMGFGPWGLDDQKKLLSQLSKMKFNRIEMLSSPFQSIRPIRLPAGDADWPEAFFPWNLPITGDVPGRKAFRGAKQFENPDLVRHDSKDARYRDGQSFVKNLSTSAHELGISVGLYLLLGYELGPDGEHKENAAQKWKRFQGYLETARVVYPTVDAFYLSPPDTADTAAFQSEAFLKWRKGAGDVFVDQSGPNKVNYPPSVGMLTSSSALAKLPDDRPHSAFVNFDNRHAVLPNLGHQKLPAAMKALQEHHADGFVAVCETPVDIDPSLYYFSRAVFDPKLTFDSALQELIPPICGEGVVDNVRLAFADVDKANAILRKEAPNLGTQFDPVLGMNGEHPPADAKWPAEVRTLFTNAMNEMYRANTRARGGARAFTLYYARRFEFGLHFMTCAEAVYNANQSTDDREKELGHLEAAQEALYAAQNALADVARDQSDRGMIALINLEAYQPLKQRLETIEKLVR